MAHRRLAKRLQATALQSLSRFGQMLSRTIADGRAGIYVANDFYCDEVLSGRTPVDIVVETKNVLAFHHTRPYWPVHIVVIPRRHIESLIALEAMDNELLVEMFDVIRQVAERVVTEHGGCRVVTNLGRYQDSKHLHWHVGSGTPLR